MEFDALGGAAFERALQRLCAGEPVAYRGMTLLLHGSAFECRVPSDEARSSLTPERALSALAGARFRLGALMASAPPIAAAVGNRAPRLVLVDASAEDAELYELRGDRLRRLPPGGSGAPQ